MTGNQEDDKYMLSKFAGWT